MITPRTNFNNEQERSLAKKLIESGRDNEEWQKFLEENEVTEKEVRNASDSDVNVKSFG